MFSNIQIKGWSFKWVLGAFIVGAILSVSTYWYFIGRGQRADTARAISDLRQVRSELDSQRKLNQQLGANFAAERASVQRLEELQRKRDDRIKFLEAKDREQRGIIENLRSKDSEDRKLIERGRELVKKM